MILNIILFCYLLFFTRFATASGLQYFRNLLRPKTVTPRFGGLQERFEYEDDDDDEITILRPILPVYYQQSQPMNYQIPSQQPSYWPNQQFFRPTMYPRQPPKEVEHRMYSTKIIDECKPQQYGSYYQQHQPTQWSQQQQFPPINLYLGRENIHHGQDASDRYSINLPSFSGSSSHSSERFEERVQTNEDREKKFHKDGEKVIYHLEKMFKEMEKVASSDEKEEIANTKKEVLKPFRSLIEELEPQYVNALVNQKKD
jgi:hypothetical protein